MKSSVLIKVSLQRSLNQFSSLHSKSESTLKRQLNSQLRKDYVSSYACYDTALRLQTNIATLWKLAYFLYWEELVITKYQLLNNKVSTLTDRDAYIRSLPQSAL